MKKLFFCIGIILIFLCCLSSVNALSCQQFSIDLPDGFEETDGWGSSAEHTNEIYAGNGIPFNGKVHRWLQIEEMGSSTDYKDYYDFDEITGNQYLLENYTEGDLFVAKYNVPNLETSVIRENFTYAHFDKDGYHYGMIITYNGNINNLRLSDDVDLVKGVKDSLRHRN